MAVEPIWHLELYKNSFSSDSFPLAWPLSFRMVLGIWHTFLYRQKSIKKLTTEKTCFYIITSLWQWRPFGFWYLYGNRFQLGQFSVGLAFVVPQGNPPGL
jgi:hypothetical protein